jgi:ATP-dependent DNA helicase RecG
MRPAKLHEFFSDVRSLEGIGQKLGKLLDRFLAAPERTARAGDLLWHFPTGINDRRARPEIGTAPVGELITLEVTVCEHKPPADRYSRSPYRVVCADTTGTVDIVFFRGQKSYLEKTLPPGATRFISGKMERFGERLQMPHPDHIVAPENIDELPLIEPVYPLTAGVSNKIMHRSVRQALQRIPLLDEWQEEQWLSKQKWPDFSTALQQVHQPENAEELLPGSPARLRLAYDELLASQLALALVRNSLTKVSGRSLQFNSRLYGRIITKLGFELTRAQQLAIQDINADMAADGRMLRLLQGDVGSGKTAVALLSMAGAVEAGTQAAMMAPTEVLARQHYKFFAEMGEKTGFQVELLTGREKGKKRQQILNDLAGGKIDMLLGTHALFQEGVEFADLGLVIIDEQHRFGVHQRLGLQAKGNADVLVMTATPIPRTLLLANYGDMDVSILDEKPAGRKPVTTKAIANNRIDEVVDGIERTIGEGTQVYWVCPLVEESEKLALVSADQRFGYLQKHFGSRVGMVHGQMSAAEKDQVMQKFTDGHIKILVATTVIEVGVDVPNATIMVIEHAERFGLSQLHQLRGRVGRGSARSSCLLVYQGPLSASARTRLQVMRETEDGFIIAEEDLKLRGGGEILGTRQSGAQAFRAATLPEHTELLAAARDDTKLILARDPCLTSKRGKALKQLLYLFERDEAVRLLRAG